MRSRSMMGFDAPYVPGWDCHGLPIEQKVDKKLGSKKRDMDAVAIRKACREYAQEFIDIQREEFQRLGVGRRLGPSLPDDGFAYEAEIARAFGGFYGKDLVYRALKSVRWCFTDRTALAEAELEYEERDGPRDQRRVSGRASPLAGAGDRLAAQASSSGRRRPGRSPRTSRSPCIPTRRTPSSRRTGAASSWPRSSRRRWRRPPAGRAGRPRRRLPGTTLEGLRYRHPLAARVARRADARGEAAASFRIVLGDYVTMDTGTGPRPHGPGPRRGRLPDRHSARACRSSRPWTTRAATRRSRSTRARRSSTRIRRSSRT